MADIIVFISVSCALLLIFIAPLEIDVIYQDTVKFEINFILITVELIFKRNDRKKTEKKSLGLSFDSVKKTVLFFSRYSSVKLNSLLILAPNTEPHLFSVQYRNALTLISMLLASFSSRVRSFYAPYDAISFISHDGGIQIKNAHLSVSAPFYILILSAMRLLFQRIRQKIKQYRTERYGL